MSNPAIVPDTERVSAAQQEMPRILDPAFWDNPVARSICAGAPPAKFGPNSNIPIGFEVRMAYAVSFTQVAVGVAVAPGLDAGLRRRDA